jgi:uncharacterized RDD family membrane protein YckC
MPTRPEQSIPLSDSTAANIMPAPPVARRMAAFLYEGVLLFGVLFVSGWLFSTLTQLRDPGHQGVWRLQIFLLLVLAIYFCWFWSHGGQTVAMKAWHVRVVDKNGNSLTQARALARFVLAWMWVLPALLASKLAGFHTGGSLYGLLLVGVLTYAALAWLHPQRQFLHDALCGTRLITWRPAIKHGA